MKRLIPFLIVAFVFAVAAFSMTPASAQSVEAPYVLVFDMDNVPSDIEGLVSAAGGELLYWFPQVGIAVAAAESDNFASEAGANAFVESVGITGQWALPEVEMFVAEFEAPTATDDLYEVFQWDIRRVGADQAGDVGSRFKRHS